MVGARWGLRGGEGSSLGRGGGRDRPGCGYGGLMGEPGPGWGGKAGGLRSQY